MPFKSGQVGNPQGRGVEKNDQKRILKNLFSPHIKEAAAEVVKMLTSEEFEKQSWAIKLLLEYSCGKPAQGVELTGEAGGPLIAVIRES